MKSIKRFFQTVILCALGLLTAAVGAQAESSYEDLAARVEPPFALGDQVSEATYEIVNLDGRVAGFAFETAPITPIPGFSGAPINLFVIIDLQGKFIDAEILTHNEPIFISGLDGTLFHKFVEQYKGLSIFDTLVVGTPYGAKDETSSLVYLDGVTKATASVRIAHESILAAAFAVAKDKLQQIPSGPPAKPDPAYEEKLTWQDLTAMGLAKRRLVTNAEVQKAFKDTLWEDDDPLALDEPDEPYLDLWIVDIGPKSIARAALSSDSFEELQEFLKISPHDEPILVIDAGRHGLVSEDFIRNTSPGLISSQQDGFPVALRDSDLDVELAKGVPGEIAMILRTDRRIGFDPTRPWSLSIISQRAHGSFRPEIGRADFSVMHQTPERFFYRETVPEQAPAWFEALLSRKWDLAALGFGLALLLILFVFRLRWLASLTAFIPVRLGVLALVIGFIGWWGQGQLSIVTPLGLMRGLYEGQSLTFLLYDPFSLMIWGVVILSFVLWGRGLYCGWLCPFGAMQEFSHKLGRLLRLPDLRLPRRLDAALVWVKYPVLFVLIFAAFLDPNLADALIEVEPFKTAVTTYFVREWYYVAYAVFWLVLGMVLFKSFCRYLCPLGAFMAIGGLLRTRRWIKRRTECGTPCQLCKVRCKYQAIKPSGKINYHECFQCLDCITIYDSASLCVPLVLEAKGRKL